MRKLRILLLVAVLAVIALIGVRAAFAASSGAEASVGKLTPAQQQPAPDRQDDGKDCPFKNRGGSDSAEPALDV